MNKMNKMNLINNVISTEMIDGMYYVEYSSKGFAFDDCEIVDYNCRVILGDVESFIVYNSHKNYAKFTKGNTLSSASDFKLNEILTLIKILKRKGFELRSFYMLYINYQGFQIFCENDKIFMEEPIGLDVVTDIDNYCVVKYEDCENEDIDLQFKVDEVIYDFCDFLRNIYEFNGKPNIFKVETRNFITYVRFKNYFDDFCDGEGNNYGFILELRIYLEFKEWV